MQPPLFGRAPAVEALLSIGLSEGNNLGPSWLYAGILEVMSPEVFPIFFRSALPGLALHLPAGAAPTDRHPRCEVREICKRILGAAPRRHGKWL